MQPNVKKTIAALAVAAPVAAMALLWIFMVRGANPTPAFEMAPPASQEAANPSYGTGINEYSHAFPVAEVNEGQLPLRGTAATTHKQKAPGGPQKARSTVAVDHHKVTESFVPLNETLESASHDNTAAVVVAQAGQALETGEVAVHGDSNSQSAFTTPSAPTFTSGEDRASRHLSTRASELLAEIQTEGAGLLFHAETLGTISRNPQFSWQSHAHYLNKVKGHINAVGERTTELQKMRYDVLPWQQLAITDVTAHAAQIAESTQAAIVHLRENQNRLFVTEYRDHVATIADRSEDMKQAVDKFLDYEEAQQKFQRLQNELELEGD